MHFSIDRHELMTFSAAFRKRERESRMEKDAEKSKHKVTNKFTFEFIVFNCISTNILNSI